VHRLLNPFGFAAGQLAVFQGASEAPIPHHFDTGGREPDLRERKMVRDAPSSRLAGGPFFNATKPKGFRKRYTKTSWDRPGQDGSASHRAKRFVRRANGAAQF
jgi:hypothetical protein